MAASDVATLLSAAFDPTPITDARFVFTVEAGPDAAKTWVVDGTTPGPAFVGTGPVAAFALSDPTVSRRHCSIDVLGARLKISDLGSRNGTRVQGVAIEAAFLEGGEHISLGQTVLRVEKERAAERRTLPLMVELGRTVGASTEMRRLYPLIERLAGSDLPTLIEGETGTGKEILAETMHEIGPRKDGPFVVFDCTAVPRELMEAELFGYERGAFTGATEARPGFLERAEGGTLFIDEIGELDLALQPKLLRVLDRSEVRRIGGDKSIRVRARIIAATRRDLDAEVAGGRFRDDLFHRLAVARLELPPLRRRRGDVPLLAKKFAKDAGFSPDALEPSFLARLESQPFPGNIRELKNLVLRQLTLGDLQELELEAAASEDYLEAIIERDIPLAEARRLIGDELERRYTAKMLERTGGNVSKAAERAGIARRHFQHLKAKATK
ncbi:MAG: sigma 54-interacting transcriptional regulator [Myxococcota bacterium]